MTTEPQPERPDLAAWLLACIEDDERVAREANVKQDDPEWRTNHVGLSDPRSFRVRSAEDARPIAYVSDVPSEDDPTGILDAEAVAPHIARHDPARVLADCEAKRKIIEQAQLFGMGRTAMRILAQPYASRPGFDESWRVA